MLSASGAFCSCCRPAERRRFDRVKVHRSGLGRLLSFVYIVPAVLGSKIVDQEWGSWSITAAVYAAALAVAARLDRVGVFDTDDGGVIVKRFWSNRRVPEDAEPAAQFRRSLIGSRMVVVTNDGSEVMTSFRTFKPVMPAGWMPPANLRARQPVETSGS